MVKVASTCKVEPFVGQPNHIVSENLQAAQQRLFKLRAALKASRSERGEVQQALPFDLPLVADRPDHTLIPYTKLPSHLGWESAAVTQTVRQTTRSVQPQTSNPVYLTAVLTKTAVSDPTPPPALPQTIKVYPDMALGLLREEQVAAGRLWLLLQAVDMPGRGWIAEKAARSWFTGKRAALRFCGIRQLRNLLARGEGIFWRRTNERIWLRSVAKVAFALGVPRLKMRPVALPVNVLRQKIGTVRAHLYATFHSSRSQPNRAQKPIARHTIAHITQVQPRTQRRYERRAQVKRQAQYAIGALLTVENLQSRSWEQGQATFQFKDFQGKQGHCGQSYVAWQLPNSYVGPHAQQPKGRQKRINRALTDLFMQGMTGNDQCAAITHCFFENGRLAAKSYLRNPENDHYWRGVGHGRYQLWQVMESSTLRHKI